MDPKLSRKNQHTTVTLLEEDNVPEADHIMRLAFGTFLGLVDPLKFMGDASYVRTRWKTDPTSAFAAKTDHELSGSVFVSNWGSVGFFGPLTIHPKYWNQGIAQLLMSPVMERLE